MAKMTSHIVYRCPDCGYETSNESKRDEHEKLPSPEKVFFEFPEGLILRGTENWVPTGRHYFLIRDRGEFASQRDHDSQYMQFHFYTDSFYDKDQEISGGGVYSLSLRDQIERGEKVFLEEYEFEELKKNKVMEKVQMFVKLEDFVRTVPELEQLEIPRLYHELYQKVMLQEFEKAKAIRDRIESLKNERKSQ